jgi:hypothetical protein
MITLDVQGQIFKTDITTINKLAYFKDMFEDCGSPFIEGNPSIEGNPCGSTSEIIFVNRPAHIFKHVISLITDDTYPYPEKYKFELDFYGYDITNVNFYNKNKEVLERVKELENKNYDMAGDIQYIYDKLKKCKIDNCNNLTKDDLYCDSCAEINNECIDCYNDRVIGSDYCYSCRT